MAIALNFRSSLAHVTDPAGTTAVLSGEFYPTTRNSVTFGASGGAFRDRNGYSDPRFAGTWYASSATAVRELQVDLPAAGTYPVKIASGDIEFGGVTDGRIRIRDGVGGAVLLDVSLGPVSSGFVYDADGVAHDQADWDANAAVDTLTFSGNKLVLELGDSTATDTGDSKLMHLEIGDAIAAGPTLSTVPATAYPSETITVTGSGLTGASADLGGEAAAVTVNSDTEIEVTISQGSLAFGTHTLTITTAGGSATDDLVLIVEPGTGGYIDVVDPAIADTSSLAYQFEAAGGDPVATGDQCQWRYTGVPGDPTSMTVEPDTLISALDQEGEVEVRFWDATDSTWGNWTTLNAAVPVVDETAPTVTSVTVPTAGTYTTGQNLNFTVNLDETGTVTTTGGTPSLPVTVGATVRQATYVSGSGTSALLFRYTVQNGDEDTDGVSVGASISLNGGTIQDSVGNNLVLTLNGVGDASGVLVDGVAPVITINPLTTTDTTPIVSGTADDAVALTLVVNGVTYNPVPSGGSWSQVLNELALGDYSMTLNGEDAAGNVAVERTASLSIVDEIITTAQGLFRPLFREPGGPINQSLFR